MTIHPSCDNTTPLEDNYDLVRIRQLEAENARLREALQPFAALITEKLPEAGMTISTGLKITSVKLYGPGYEGIGIAKTECLARLEAALLAIHERNKSDD